MVHTCHVPQQKVYRPMTQVHDQLQHRVRREYSVLAPIYDRVWRRYVARTVQATLGHLRLAGDERVLDVGCGTGSLLATLHERYPNLAVHGVDLTAAMLERARRRLGPGVNLHLGSGDALPYPDSHFDAVVSTSVLHCLGDRQRPALCEWARVLRPGGTLVITDWNPDHPATRAHTALLRVFWRARYRPMPAEALEAAVRAAGLRVTDTESYLAGTWGVTTLRAELSTTGLPPGIPAPGSEPAEP